MFDCPLKQAAQDAPNQLAFLSSTESLTFSQLDKLADSLPVKQGELIAIRRPPDAYFIALIFAALRRDAPLFPINLRLPDSQIDELLARFRLPPSSFCLCLATSGSTGTPKIAVLSFANLMASASAAITSLDLKPGDQWLLSLPLYHVGGIGILFRCIFARAAIVLDEKSPDITHMSYVPTQLYRSWPVYKKLRCLMLGGAPGASYPDCLPIYMTYGLTEMGSLVTVRRHPPQIDGHFYLGHPLPGREARIKDGEIQVRGQCLFQGYWESGEIVSPVDQDGWFSTGDLGIYCPKEGLAVTGRKDWQFISGGENIQPEEIERELLALPQIAEAVVVPVKDPEFGQRPAAIVKVCGDIDLIQMQRALCGKLPKYKIPASLHLLEELPKKGLKIDRKKITELVAHFS